MRSERGQATVEWVGIVLLVAIVLVALGRLASRHDGQALATTVARSVTCAARDGCRRRTPAPRPPARRSVQEAFSAPVLLPRPGQARPPLRLPSGRALLRWASRAGDPALAARLRRGTGAAWRRAWIACLVYERFRYAFMHPESRFPGHTIPPSELLRILNDCISPLDLVRDWPELSRR